MSEGSRTVGLHRRDDKKHGNRGGRKEHLGAHAAATVASFPGGPRRARGHHSRPILAFVAVLVVLGGLGTWSLRLVGADSSAKRPTVEGLAAPATSGLASRSAGSSSGHPTPSATTTPSQAADPASRTSHRPSIPTAGVLVPAPTTAAHTTTPAAALTSTAAAATTNVGTTAAAGSTPEDQVVTLVNAERAKAGCAALRVDSRLAAAAEAHSKDMVDRNYFSHTDPDGNGPGERAAAVGYPQWSGENIAMGYPTAAAGVDAWMNSAGHRANILNCSSKATGVGYDPRENMWTQMFGYV